MRFLTVFLSLLLMATTLEAQRGGGGFRGRPQIARPGTSVMPAFRPDFRPGFNSGMWNFRRPSYYSYPFFPYTVPSPLYSEPLYTEPLYSTQTYVPPYPASQYNYDGVIDDLRSQVQQLTYQVQQLQAELQAARGSGASATTGRASNDRGFERRKPDRDKRLRCYGIEVVDSSQSPKGDANSTFRCQYRGYAKGKPEERNRRCDSIRTEILNRRRFALTLSDIGDAKGWGDLSLRPT